MTELEKKAEEYVLYIPDTVDAQHSVYSEEKLKQAYKDGYEQGQKDNCETHKECQFLKYFEKENEELKAIISKLKCCGNCKHWRYSCLNEDYICKRTEEIIKSLECYTEKMDKCDKWELAK